MKVLPTKRISQNLSDKFKLKPIHSEEKVTKRKTKNHGIFEIFDLPISFFDTIFRNVLRHVRIYVKNSELDFSGKWNSKFTLKKT